MNFKKIITDDGWFSNRYGAIFSIGGLAVAIIPWFFGVSTGYGLLLTLIGSVISLIGSYEGKARQFRFQAPFAQDPLGWRKAKESYRKVESDPNRPADPDPES